MALFLFAAPRQSYYPHHRKKEGIVLVYYSAITLNKSDILPQVVLLWFYVMYSPFKRFTAFLQRGKTVPEELVRSEDLSKYRQVASHAVSTDFCLSINTFISLF